MCKYLGKQHQYHYTKTQPQYENIRKRYNICGTHVLEVECPDAPGDDGDVEAGPALDRWQGRHRRRRRRLRPDAAAAPEAVAVAQLPDEVRQGARSAQSPRSVDTGN